MSRDYSTGLPDYDPDWGLGLEAAGPSTRGVSLFSAATLRLPLMRLVALCILLLLFAPAAAAVASEDDGDSLATRPGQPLLGAVLEWGEDDAVGFSERLGATPAILGHEVSFPMKDVERRYLRDFLSQSAAVGSNALLTVNPTVPLTGVDAGNAAEFAGDVEQLADGFPGKLLIRFAPDMNSNWIPWGQQPEAYVSAFRTVAEAFSDMDAAVMVWQPFLGRDYPYSPNHAAPSPGTTGFATLDTNGDGLWNRDDDAYSPYYPGDESVDWVGLTASHDDTGGAAALNTLPADGELAAMLTGRGAGGDKAGGENFYAQYSGPKPLLLQTSAYYSPSAGGPGEAEIKSAWWRQVLAEVSSPAFDRVGAVVWDERTAQGDTGTVAIDWRLTRNGEVAAEAGRLLKESALVTGPVTEEVQDLGSSSSSALAGTGISGSVLSGPAAWLVGGALLVGACILWLLPARLGSARNWRYQDTSSRDARVDMLRGLAILFVVVNHVGITSLFQLFTQEAVGFVSGAELFVLLSGVVVGMVYGPKAANGMAEVLDKTSKRAGKLYLTALVVVTLVFIISLIPAVNTLALTTFTDQGTGGVGRAAAGRSYDLFSGMQGLLEYPVPGAVIPAVLLLQFGPWQFNVMGLYVVMLLLSPLILWALSRGKTVWVLAASAALYVVGTVFRFRLLPSQFEDSFPLLVWQVLFVLGIVAGYHRGRLVNWLRSHRWVVAVCVALTVAFAFLSWANPYLANEFDVRVASLTDTSFRALYENLFGRTYLEPGRLLNVLVLLVTVYALLTAYWKPLERALGWLLIPLGRATLYVFILHIVLIAVVSNIPWLQKDNIWLNTAAYAGMVALLWVMVRTRFLFRIIPT